MKKVRLALPIAALLLVSTSFHRAAGGPPPGPAPVQAGSGEPVAVSCVFTNPAFSGTCTESASAPKGTPLSQACQPILDCLNSPSCSKTYCQATSIRSGWQLKSATAGPKKP